MLNNNDIMWKPIKGFEKLYLVSSEGKIKSIASNKIRSTFIRSKTCQYEYVQLYKNNKPHTHAVHRLVAKAFIPNDENKPMVNHKNGDKLNNNYKNLEWCTCSENHKHAFKNGLRTPPRSSLGKKWGTGSKYHNVTFDKNRNKWIGSIKINKKQYPKRFNTEIEAALYVNELIDKFSLIGRSKNIII